MRDFQVCLTAVGLRLDIEYECTSEGSVTVPSSNDMLERRAFIMAKTSSALADKLQKAMELPFFTKLSTEKQKEMFDKWEKAVME